LEDSIWLLDRKAFEDFTTTLWNIWNDRNNDIFWGKEEDVLVIWETTHKLNDDFQIHNFSIQLILPRSLNFDKVIFEVDCACIVNYLCKYKDGITIFGYRIKEVHEMPDSFSKAEAKWVNRGDNKVADFFCKWSLSNCCNLTFEMDYPSDIHNL
ncbi:hypothetical protein Gorai_016945, partial [Gossypium raimondii]|nr:hypothetical protein [Gossypium raimondii]